MSRVERFFSSIRGKILRDIIYFKRANKSLSFFFHDLTEFELLASLVGAILKDRSFLFKKSRDEASFVYNSSLEKSAVETIEMVCERRCILQKHRKAGNFNLEDRSGAREKV